MTVCPNCGWKQPRGTKCAKCGTLFSDHKRSAQSKPVAKTSVAEQRVPRRSARLRTAGKIARWSTYLLLAFSLRLILHKADPPQLPSEPAAAQRAEKKMRALDAAQSAGQPYSLELDGPELNAYLERHLLLAGADSTNPPASGHVSRAGSAPENDPPVAGLNDATTKSVEEARSQVKDVKVDLVGDLVKAYVVFDFHGKDLSLSLSGHLSSGGGYLKFEPLSGALGSFPLPQSALESAVRRMMESPENREKLRLPDEVREVRVENSEVLIEYR